MSDRIQTKDMYFASAACEKHHMRKNDAQMSLPVGFQSFFALLFYKRMLIKPLQYA